MNIIELGKILFNMIWSAAYSHGTCGPRKLTFCVTFEAPKTSASGKPAEFGEFGKFGRDGHHHGNFQLTRNVRHSPRARMRLACAVCRSERARKSRFGHQVGSLKMPGSSPYKKQSPGFDSRALLLDFRGVKPLYPVIGLLQDDGSGRGKAVSGHGACGSRRIEVNDVDLV